MNVKVHCIVHETLTQCYCSLIIHNNILKHLEGKSARVCHQQYLQRELGEVKREKQVCKDNTSIVALVYIQNCQTYTVSLAVKDLTYFINRLKTFNHGIVLIL